MEQTKNTNRLELAKTALAVLKRQIRPQVSRANLAVTYVCNYHCATCHVWRIKPNYYNELRPREIEKIIDQNKLIWLSITGGEPFLRSDIADCLKVCSEKLRVTSIITNGSKPAFIEDTINKMLQTGNSIVTINVSLEGNKTTHDNFTRVATSWDKAIETLDRLSRIRCNRLKLGIEHLISKHTLGQYDYIRQIAKLFRANTTFTIEQDAFYYNKKCDNAINLEMPKTQFKANLFQLVNELFISKAHNHRNHNGARCVAGEYSCFIDPYGTVYPCIFYIPQHPIFNLRDTSYRIGKLDCNKLRAECSGCWTPCESYATMIFRPWRLL